MSRIDHEKLSLLEKEFKEHPGGIELPNFVWLLKCTVGHPPEDQYRVMDGLVKLFSDIDINGDQHIEWSEFTQYIVDAVIAKNAADEPDDYGVDDEQDHKLNAGQALLLKEAFNTAEKSYSLRQDLSEKESFRQCIAQVERLPAFRLTFVREENSDKVKVLDDHLVCRQIVEPPRSQNTRFDHLLVCVTDIGLNAGLGFVGF